LKLTSAAISFSLSIGLLVNAAKLTINNRHPIQPIEAMDDKQSKLAPRWICNQIHSPDSHNKMPPHPYEFHFVTPPCSPKRRGSPPSCDTDVNGVPLFPPPSLSRNPRLPSPSNSSASFGTPRNEWFSTGDLSELESNYDDGARSSDNSPSKDVPSVIDTIDIDNKSPPAASPRSKALIERRRRRFVEHRRARSIDTSSITLTSPSKSDASKVDSPPKIYRSSKSDSTRTKVSTPERSDGFSLKSSSTKATPQSSDRSIRTNNSSPKSSKNEECSMVAELAALRAWKEIATKEHEATVQALEKTVAKHAGEIEELKRQADEAAVKYARNAEGLRSQIEEQQRDIDKKKNEIKELEDMVIWSETTLANKLDESKESVKAKDGQIVKLTSELASAIKSNDAKAMEIGELKTWKQAAETDVAELNLQCMNVMKENRELKGQLANTEERLQAKSIECMSLSKKLEQLAEKESQLESKEAECMELKQQMDEQINNSEVTIAGLMEDIAKDAKIYSEKIAQLESELSTKTAEYEKTCQEVSNYKCHLTEASYEISELCNKLHARKTEISDLHKQIGENDVKFERTLAAMTESNAKETEKYTERISVLESEVSEKDSLLEKALKTLDEVRDAVAELESLKSDIVTKDGKIDELLKEIVVMRGDATTLETNLKAALKDVDETEMKSVGLKNELSTCQSELAAEKNKNKEVSEKLAMCEESSAEKQVRIDECESNIDALKQMNTEYQGVIESEIEKARLLATQLDESKEDCAAKVDLIDSLNDEVSALKADIEARTKKACLLMQDLTDRNDKYAVSQGQVVKLESQISDHEKTISDNEAEARDLKRTIELQNESILSLEQTINAKNHEISALRVELTTTDHNIQHLQDLLQESKEEFKNQLLSERGNRIQATRHLESSLVEKEEEIKHHLESMKNASAAMTRMESKVVSLQLVNDTLVVERDELTRWRRDVEEQMKVKDLRADDLMSQIELLRKDCRELGDLLKQREAESRSFDVKLDFESRERTKLEAITIEKSKEVEFLRDQNSKLSNKVDELGKDMNRQIAKFKIAQQAIAGLEKTLKVSFA
jgi:chromosome segregation ATPase